jgi:hypothetical protein
VRVYPSLGLFHDSLAGHDFHLLLWVEVIAIEAGFRLGQQLFGLQQLTGELITGPPPRLENAIPLDLSGLGICSLAFTPALLSCQVRGDGAHACAEYLSKGRTVAVTGRLVYREWEKDGVKRSKHQVVGRVTFGGRDTADAQVAGDDQDSDQ